MGLVGGWSEQVWGIPAETATEMSDTQIVAVLRGLVFSFGGAVCPGAFMRGEGASVPGQAHQSLPRELKPGKERGMIYPRLDPAILKE